MYELYWFALVSLVANEDYLKRTPTGAKVFIDNE
jgi:hypothetical protein